MTMAGVLTDAGMLQEAGDVLKGKSVTVRDCDLPTDGRREGIHLVTKMNVCYIVCGVLINEQDDILMMQEAKPSCCGQWYLPAGRMEVNETIEEATRREVLEETGVEFRPTTMLAMEMACGYWYRFTMTGTVTGGKLKTVEQKDKESIQAEWMSLEKIKSKDITLRATDILPLITLALQHRSATKKFDNLLPHIIPRDILAMRLFLFCRLPDNGVHILVTQSTASVPHLPLTLIKINDNSFTDALLRGFKALFGSRQLTPTVYGVLSVEHCGKPAAAHDGMVFTVLVSVPPTDQQLPAIANSSAFKWCAVDAASELGRSLENRLKPNMCVPLYLLG